MELFDLLSSDHFHVILHPDKRHGLIFNRLDGTVSNINHDDAAELSNLKTAGQNYGIIGHYLKRYLVLIKNRCRVGTLYEPRSGRDHEIYVITQVQVIDVTSTPKTSECSRNSSVKYNVSGNNEDAGHIDMDTLGEHSSTPSQDFASLPITISTYSSMQSKPTVWNPFKIANSLKPMVPRQLLRSVQTTSDSSFSDKNMVNSNQANCQLEDSDRRLIEEMVKLFTNTNSFYYSPTLDLTNRFSRKNLSDSSLNEPIWKTADERFFWNKYMLKDLIELSKTNEDTNHFICVILQGFITIENHAVLADRFNEYEIEPGLPATSMNTLQISSGNSDCDNNLSNSNEENDPTKRFALKGYQLALVSRRSVFQAGTRYRRRGCDEAGNSANYVETEQIFRYNQHFKSLVILRGSIPLYWYQTGYNYRPPPVLIRSESENQTAFSKHFNKLIELYETDHIISIDCTEHTGREKVLHDAFRKHIDLFSSDHRNIKLVEFDFHRHCRGRQCTDAQIERHLISCGLTDQMMKDAKYYWNDGDVVLNQEGVFRVNCLDCSDRTNVVQRAIALKILDLQLARLGLIAPDSSPEDNECRKIMQAMWAANGNVLSTQYCGTRALFGGDRKLSAYLKDTYSSASRYYISKFRDAYRQAAIDAMLGVESPDPSLQHSGLKDQFELMNLDPILATRSGGALLKDVGNRVSNRIARLRGKFHSKPTIGRALDAEDSDFYKYDIDEPELTEDDMGETLDRLNIDWPSSESVNADQQNQTNCNLFARYSNVDDSFQDDDEFGQLMLSIDIAELQRLQDSEPSSSNNESQDNKDQSQPEEINMTEACGPKMNPTSGSPKVETFTTST